MDEIRQPYMYINMLKKTDASYRDVDMQSNAVLLLLPWAESSKSMFQEPCRHKRAIIICTVIERLKQVYYPLLHSEAHGNNVILHFASHDEYKKRKAFSCCSHLVVISKTFLFWQDAPGLGLGIFFILTIPVLFFDSDSYR